MTVIRVPAPDAKAFQKNRRASDLVLSQVKHLQHLVHKHDIPVDAAIAEDIHTEGGAARYIAAVTRAIRSQASAPSGEKSALPIDQRRRQKRTKRSPAVSTGISIAASVEKAGPRSEMPAESAPGKKPKRKKTKKAPTKRSRGEKS
jgi:hypothetical protein